ncbi:MAG TPA: hypothetical protein VLK33_08190, partial [Terriglobales bacterium]|nr:hypothetical protein [Terriglobales bacterium]
MKLNRFMLVLAIIAVILLMFSVYALHAQTNDISLNTPVISDPIIPSVSPLQNVAYMFKGYDGWIAKAMAFLLSFKLAMSPFAGKITRALSDWLNAVADTKDIHQDEWLSRLFATAWYKTLAFLLTFISIRLPTQADLIRMVGAQ